MTKFGKASCLVLVALGLCALSPSADAGDGADPPVLPPQSNPHGMSYGEWGAEWWQWAYSIPAGMNPVADLDGSYCDVGQSGSVWFLAGTFGGDATRDCTISTGTALFFPIVSTIFGPTVGDCDPEDLETCDVEEFRADAEGIIDFVLESGTLTLTIDGEPVEDVETYRATSPEAFEIEVPEDYVRGDLYPDVEPGTYGKHITSGVWAFVHPLTPGPHTIEFSVNIPELIEFTIVYNLFVELGAGPD